MIKRPSIDAYFLELAKTASIRSVCVKRQVGAVVVDAADRIMSSGYNGPPPRSAHCERQCTTCKNAVHAEANALLQCSHVKEIATIYITISPCIECAKLIASTGCKRVVYGELNKTEGAELLNSLGITCEQLP